MATAPGVTPAGEAPRVLVIDAAVNARPDIVVLDLMLPGLPGEQLLERLRTVSAV